MRSEFKGRLAVLLTGVCLGAGGYELLAAPRREARAEPAKAAPTVESLAAELEIIKGKLPDQSHVMKDVSYHFGNLWFAAEQENWELANFYLSETRSHLRWAVRMIPKRKDNAGHEIDLGAILEAFENSPWKQMKEALEAKDKPEFEKKYRFALETCYGCHKAVDKPYLRPQMPSRPETAIINFDPRATWPQ